MDEVLLSTARMTIRALTFDDVENLRELDSDPDVVRYVGRAGPPEREFIRQWIARITGMYSTKRGFWALTERASGEFMGWIHLITREGMAANTAEIGYRLRKKFWGRGYATESSLALMTKSFSEWNVVEVTALALAENNASIRVMEKCGLRFKETSTLPIERIDERIRSDFSLPERRRMVAYAITGDRFLAEQGAVNSTRP
ncbi:MAG: GNAT family N-acetyltransferase [Planctomycetes bacterium]|nr:GNAT family N-acetyltransferase [Planctomycetota bacterium]